MAAVVGARGTLPSYYTGAESRTEPAVISFEKELDYFTALIKRAGKKPATAESRQKVSNTLFALWNSYAKRLAPSYFTQQLLATGDLLYQAQEYSLARTHCYGRYLDSIGLGEADEEEEKWGEKVADYFQRVEEQGLIVAALRALIGEAVCCYFLTEKEDPKLMHGSSRSAVLSALQSLQCVTQVALQRETHYWLVYNGVVLIYTIGRRMMSRGYSDKVLEYLLWGAVCMESSVPLMAVRYLQLRASLYTAVCQCYYDIREPHQAELFARRGLDKVHELAQLEHQSSSEATESSEEVFREVSLKLGVMVFKRSVLESRKKSKSVYRPKVRPTIRDLLQLPTPRSPTEKLLVEMFSGVSAQFLAVLETLTESWRRPLNQAPPSTVSDLDQETVLDIYQELFCVGTDLSQKVLTRLEEGSTNTEEVGLMVAASKGGDAIPLGGVVRFVRLAYCYDQCEVFELLAERVVRTGKTSTDDGVRSKVRSLQLLLAVDSLRSMWRAHKTNTDETRADGHSEELVESLQHLSRELHAACDDPALLSSDFDLLLDSALLLWEVAQPAFSRVHSHEYASCRQLLSNKIGKQYLSLLQQVVTIFHMLGVWQVDPLLLGEVSLKLGCLHEASADLRHNKQGETLAGETSVILYDRSQLLECLAGLREGLQCIKHARRSEHHQHNTPPQTFSDLEVLHAEFLLAVTRVQLKLASTIPPPRPLEGTQKPSSLRSKVKERREKEEQWQRTLSGLTAANVSVETEAELHARCGRDRYSTALLLMLQASSSSSRLEPTAREALLEESFSYLLQLSQEPKDISAATPPPSTTPPPPLLLHCTDTTMKFKPAPFQPKGGQKVAYYCLYGRPAAGSNVKVRLADKHFPGLGVEVGAGRNCTLEVHGLQPSEEYVFAVAAYTSTGELVGGAIGQTGRPLVSTHRLPLLIAWGYLCQCAYTTGVYTVAKRVAAVLWRECVESDSGGDGQGEEEEELQLYKLKSTLLSSAPLPFLRHFVQSVFIHVKVALVEGSLLADRLCEGGPLRHTQLERMELVWRMFAGLEAAGMLNDASLCLQAVVMCYGLLAPLIQHSITTKPLVQMLLYCHAAFGEMPDSLLAHKHSNTASSLHHMIAATTYHLGKVLLTWHEKTLFSLVTDNARGLLLTTLPSTSKWKDTTSLPSTTTAVPGSQLSARFAGHDLSTSSYTSISSGTQDTLPMSSVKGGKGGGRGKRKGRKKVVTTTDHLPEEFKSAEYKAFEAFLKANHAPSPLDDFDLTGQEDPVILHTVIATLPSQLAYKEVHKFRRRPQYLEFFVHLASSTVSKGHTERVLEWGQEAFTWLTRRNELLLSTKPSHSHKGGSDHSKPAAQPQKPKHSAKTLPPPGSATALVPVRQSATPAGRQREHLRESADSPHKTAVIAKEQSHVTRSPAVKKSGRTSSQHSRSLAVVKVTKDDLKAKARSVLQSLLPELWRNHKCRKRLREVCSEELPWRSQANLLLATCCLDRLLGKPSRGGSGGGSEGGSGEGSGGGRGGENEAKPSVQPHWLRFDTAGVIINGVIPIHPDALPGQKGGRKDAVVNSEEQLDLDPPSNNVAAARPPPLQQPELCRLFTQLKRAVVLAHRGEQWTLLQNACRALWNTINTLVTGVEGSEEEEEGERVVYGLACKPLYFAASALTDLLLHSKAAPAPPQPPPTTSLKFTSHLDDCNTVDLAFIQRLVFLALHVLHSHQHWEKTIDIATRFDDITNHCWSEELVPVILSAQERLSQRMEIHRRERTETREVLEPAAHLDPGPEGHDVYGGVGHALTLVSVPLDMRATQQRLEGRGRGAERSLSHCRQLLARYLAGINRDSVGAHPPTSSSLPTVDVLDISPLPSAQLPTVIAAYDAAIVSLVGAKETELAVMAMHELGNVMYHTHNTKSAGHWWLESLSKLLQTKDPLNSWRKLTAGGGGVDRDPLLESCGVWGCLLGAILATKLAKYIYRSELDIRLEYTLLAAALFKSVLSFSLPYPLSDLDYATFPHHLTSSAESSQRLLPGLELFSDPHRCDPPSLLSSLHCCSQELVTRNHPVKVLPVLWLYQYVAHSVCRSVEHAARVKVLKLQALCDLSMLAESLALLEEIKSGARLPQRSSELNRPPDTHGGSGKFSNSLPLHDPRNIKALNATMERVLSPSLAKLYGESVTAWLVLAQAKLFTAIAATCTAVPRQSLLRTPSDQRPSTATSIVSAPPTSSSAPSSAASVHSGCSVQSSRRTRGKLPLAADDIKASLLDHSERLLVNLCHQLESRGEGEGETEVQVRAYLQLAQISLILHHSLTAVQLSLAAMRMLQGKGGRGGGGGSLSHGMHDMRLWLVCRVMLARSLVGRSDGGEGGRLVECEGQCEEGVKECEACGEVELTAELHYTAALHALTCKPHDPAKISSHTQNTLQLLESLPELSPHARLLRCQASILLADVSCVQGGATWEDMAQVFQGLATMLETQLKDESLRLNIYRPQRVLLASVQLRLAHVSTLLATTTVSPGLRKEHVNTVRRACEEAGETLSESAWEDPCLAAELAFHYGWLQDSGLELESATPGMKASCTADSSLLDASRMVAGCAVDYRLAFMCYCELAQSFAMCSQQPFKPPLSQELAALVRSSPLPGDHPKRSSSRASLKTSQQEPEREKTHKAEREWAKEREREAYNAWALVKTALQTQCAVHNLQLLTSELHNQEVTKPIPDKVLAELPDFVLLDLCQSKDFLSVLTTSLEPPSIQTLAPKSQLPQPARVSWFRVAVYAEGLMQQCYWQKAMLLSDTDWGLHYHSLTASAYAKCCAVVKFLSKHFSHFAKKSTVPPPPPLLLFSTPSSSAPPATPLPSAHVGGQSVAPPQTEPYLTAGDGEVSVVWYRPFPACHSPSSDALIGLFALNSKAIKTYPPPNIGTSGVEVYPITTSVSALSTLHSSWKEVAVAAKAFHDMRAASRPVSRSPSKRKKSEKALKAPVELQSKLTQAVQLLCATFGQQRTEDQLPRIELHTVASVMRALHPLTHTTVKGDAYYFLASVFKP